VSDDFEDLPDEAQAELDELMDQFDPSIDELLMFQIEALITEAEEQWAAELEAADTDVSVNPYTEPYELGPAKLWRLTDQGGIDSEFVTWWLASLALEDDGSPLFLVHDAADEITINKVERSALPRLADAFAAVEEHHRDQVTATSETQSRADETPPVPSDLSPTKFSEDNWDYVVSPAAVEAGETSLAIRRAPVLDTDTLKTYVVELWNHPKNGDIPSPVGAFWGHHATLIKARIEDALERLG
jgi:hypothetical protein